MDMEDAKQSVEMGMLLAKRLDQCPQVKDLDDPGHNEVDALSRSLVDLDEAAVEYREKFARLMESGTTGQALDEELVDVSMTLMHILYHIQDSRFFWDSLEPLSDEWRAANKRSS